MSTAKWTLRWASIAVVGTALVAGLDEWHQSFIPSRTGRWQDVVLDTCAGIAAQILLLLWWKVFGKGTTSVVPSEAGGSAEFSR
jgi:VanZ family protein